MKKENANQKLIGDENTKIEALETEQDKLKQEYNNLNGDHSHNVKRIEAIKNQFASNSDAISKLKHAQKSI